MSGKGVEERGSERCREPRGSLTNGSTRAEGISKASAGQMQLRERANKKANKVAGPDESDGMAGNDSQLDGEDHCGREETGRAFLSQEMRGKCPEWLRKHSLRGEEKKGTANVNSGSWTKPGKGWRCRAVGSRAKGRGHPPPYPQGRAYRWEGPA